MNSNMKNAGGNDDAMVSTSLVITHKGFESRDSSVGIAAGYGLDDRMIGVRFPTGSGNFSLRSYVQTGYGSHLASYPMGTGGSFPVGKAAGA
jgi:hypothetical protein